MLHIILFFATYVFGFLFSILSSPAYAFALYEAVYFFNPRNRWWGNDIPEISYSYFVVMLMAFTLVFNYWKSAVANKLLDAPQFKWIYLIFLLYAVTWFIAESPDRHYKITIYLLKLIIILSIAYKLIDTNRKLDFAIWGYLFGSWYISFLIFQTGRNSGNRVEGIGTVDTPDSNGIAAALAPSLVLSLYYFWISKPKYFKLMFALAGVFVANALILINSRGAFLAAFLGISYFMFFMYFSSVKLKYQKVAAMWITIFGIVGLIYLADTSSINRAASIQNVEMNEEEHNSATRIYFWIAAWEMAKDYPFGAGAWGFEYHGPDYIPAYVNTGGGGRGRSVHSSWFEALTEIGYLGLFLLLMMLYSCFKATRKCLSNLKDKGDFENYFKVIALEAALLSFMVAMSFMNRFRAEVLYWLILYTACAYNIYVIKSRNHGKKDNDKNVTGFSNSKELSNT